MSTTARGDRDRIGVDCGGDANYVHCNSLCSAKTAGASADRREQLQGVLSSLGETLRSCKELIYEFVDDNAKAGTGILGLVRKMFGAGNYEARFLGLAEGLTTCVHDMTFALQATATLPKLDRQK